MEFSGSIFYDFNLNLIVMLVSLAYNYVGECANDLLPHSVTQCSLPVEQKVSEYDQ